MFAGAAREVVFSNPEVVRRVNEQFIPVALKAAQVNNPPGGVEGLLYAEIARSKPAPQGICTMNSAGKVLTWALSFDDDQSVLEYLDHVVMRYKQNPRAHPPVRAERYMKFPSHPLASVEDNGRQVDIPTAHREGDRCPASPAIQRGTVVGRIIGRPLDEHGQPISDTLRQEHYMEARFEISVPVQEQLADAVQHAHGQRFRVPSQFARSLIAPAYLGQLDVSPLGSVPGSHNNHRHWEFTGESVRVDDRGLVRVRLEGRSHVEGAQEGGRNVRSDGRLWEHRVTLDWQGYVDIVDRRVTELVMVAQGDERLRWGNAGFQLVTEPDAAHLMAGHPIDLECGVRYGLLAKQCAE